MKKESEAEYAIHRYAKTNNKDMKNYDKNIESSSVWMGNVSNIRRKWFWMDETVIWIWRALHKNHDEINDKGYVLEVDVEYPKNLFNLHCDLPFSPERKKRKRKMQEACL